jgi:aspartyl-tRNA(Asn)/glutamyl-tRNA(Gln) amidotransferase subunit B
LEAVLAEDKDPEAIIRERGWEQITDPAQIAEVVSKVFDAEQATVTELRAAEACGNARRRQTLAAFLVGKVLAATGGRADPKIAGGSDRVGKRMFHVKHIFSSIRNAAIFCKWYFIIT